MAEPYQFFDREADGNVAVVTMNRPPVNALSGDFLDELVRLLDELEPDPAVRAVAFFSANERIFLAGADLAGAMSGGAEGRPVKEVVREMVGRFQGAFDRLEAFSKPTVAAVAGHALGGGLEFCLACDFRTMVADRRATIGLTEIRLGILPGAGGTQRLPRVVGEGRATDMILRGKRLLAEDALEIGLVHEIYPPAQFREKSLALAHELAEGATVAIGKAKACIHKAFGGDLKAGLEAEAEAFTELVTTQDAMEGISAFFARRKPEFKGQ